MTLTEPIKYSIREYIFKRKNTTISGIMHHFNDKLKWGITEADIFDARYLIQEKIFENEPDLAKIILVFSNKKKLIILRDKWYEKK